MSRGRRLELAGCDRTEMAPGDVFVIETPGAGGYGRPLTAAEASRSG